MKRQCEAIIQETSQRCRAYAQRDGRMCFLHSDPDKAAEAQKKGGITKAKRQKARIQLRLKPVKLESLEDAKKLLALTINQFRAGEVSESDAKTVGYLTSQFVTATKESNVEKRLDELEQLVENVFDKDSNKDAPLFDLLQTRRLT